MEDRAWTLIEAVLEECFSSRRPWSERTSGSYRLMLDAYEPEAVTLALRKIAAGGQKYRPSAGDIIAAIEEDPGVPTFEELYRRLFASPGGILSKRPDQCVLEAAALVHPFVAVFVEEQGIQRLRTLPIYDEDYGELRLKELREAWDRLVARQGDRLRHGLALAAGGHKQLGRLEPLSLIAGGGRLIQLELGA